ncbi:MAG: FtsW/RodA/SpoVE family cell cycle protein [Oscillospiraceae bacterium]|nr:FtsW/RodA/SpoVE family cell cycle protein [Oscillospiraceae bacterium]
MGDFLDKVSDFVLTLVDRGGALTTLLRYVFPVLVLIILIRCAISLLGFRKEPEIWGHIAFEDGSRLPVTHWENIIGRNRSSDIRMNFENIYKQHAVLTRYDDGSWTIGDVGGRGGVAVNGQIINGLTEIGFGDLISLNGLEVTLVPISKEEAEYVASCRTNPKHLVSPALTLILLTVFQFLTVVQLMIGCDEEYWGSITSSFLLVSLIMWGLFVFNKVMHRSGFEVETIAFLLCTMGLSVIASVVPEELLKTVISIILGIVIFMVIGFCMRELETAKKLRYIAAALGPVLLLAVLVFGMDPALTNGARGWIKIGPMTIQPSELVKISFVFAGASTMDRLMTRRNLFLFIVYSGLCCGILALCNDFGSALVFFVAFVVIAYLRSGDFATISLICAGTGFAGMLALKLKPHAAARFSTWRHVWEDPLVGGFQQTRALMCIAAGGLFGLGAGNGKLKYIFAADSDIAFATVCEEWGLIVGICCVLAVLCIAMFAVRSASLGRSSFYTIAACAAMGMLVFQMALNVFGTIDFLPFTGVTFPFLSNGGSSMMSAWGLLAFVKAADTRQNASFATKVPANAKRRSRG